MSIKSKHEELLIKWYSQGYVDALRYAANRLKQYNATRKEIRDVG